MSAWLRRAGKAWMPGLWFALAYLVYTLILHPRQMPQWRDLPAYAGAWLGFVLGSATYGWWRDIQRQRDSRGN